MNINDCYLSLCRAKYGRTRHRHQQQQQQRSLTYLRDFEHMRTGALDTTSSVRWALAFFAALLRAETQPEEEKKQTGSAVCIRRCRQIILFFISDSLVLVGGIMSLKVNWIIKCVNLVLNLRACFSCHDACRHPVLHVVGHCSHFAYLVVAFSIKKTNSNQIHSLQ